VALDLRGICPLLQVFDMPESLAFYRDLLGFEIIATAPPAATVTNDAFGWVWLRHGQTQLMLNTAYDPNDERPTTREPARVAAHDDTILYIGAPDVDETYRHLQGKGLRVDPPKITHYRMKQLMVKDPDGFPLCFQWAADQASTIAPEGVP
jgi:glyoxylase I family protein